MPGGILAAVVGAFVYVGAVDPNEPGHYPACPLLQYAGVYCPGCGGLRSAHAVAHGDLLTALGANAVAVVGISGVRGRVDRLGGPLRSGAAAARRSEAVLLWGLGALLLVFTVVRNLPFGGWLHP